MGVLTSGSRRRRGGRRGGFNPLHRGMGVLTRECLGRSDRAGEVSILYIEAWGY